MLVVSLVRDLSEGDYLQCSKLNYAGRYWSPMQNGLQEKRGYAYLIKDKDEVLAWALVLPKKKDSPKEAYFYVPVRNRRQGYGRVLAEEVYKKHPDAQVSGWNKTSRKFFQNFNFTNNPVYDLNS